MNSCFRYLHESEVERLHEESLRVLSEIGMSLWDDDLCRFLRKQGIPVDERNLVRFPAEVVREALDVAPRHFPLCGHDGQALPHEPGCVHPSTAANALYVWDYDTQNLRPSTKEDLRRLVLVGDALPEVHFVGAVCWATDMPEATQGLHSIATLLANTTKHNHAAPQDVIEAEIWTDLASIADQEANLKDGASLHFAVSPTNPLQLDPDTAQVMRYGAERDIPLMISSCPMAGATSPYTIAGTVVQVNAEILFLLTLVQLIREGTPVILGSASGSIDVRTGDLSYGCVERHLMLGAIGELIRYHGLPMFLSGGQTDAVCPDVQSGAEKMLNWVSRLFVEDVKYGFSFGGLLTASAASLEQMVIDADTFKSAKRFVRGIQIDQETIGLEAIKRVGPGGNYLMDEHTLHWMRSEEHYYSPLVNREGPQGNSMLERAHVRVEGILREHQSKVSEGTQEKIEEYVETMTRSLDRI